MVPTRSSKAERVRSTSTRNSGRCAPRRYVYRFDFTLKLLRTLGIGAMHGVDLLPVFGVGERLMPRLMTMRGGAEELREITQHVQGNWISFARTGAPLPQWPKYTTENRSTLLIDSPPQVVHDLGPAIRTALGKYAGPYGEKRSA
jgi:para-nitrobenzyl esterase